MGGTRALVSRNLHCIGEQRDYNLVNKMNFRYLEIKDNKMVRRRQDFRLWEGEKLFSVLYNLLIQIITHVRMQI